MTAVQNTSNTDIELGYCFNFLVVMRGFHNQVYEEEFTYSELFDFVNGDYRNNDYSPANHRSWQEVRQFVFNERERPCTCKNCGMHLVFCAEKVPCYSLVSGLLLRAFSRFNVNRKDAFMLILNLAKQTSIYFNNNINQTLSNISSYGSQWFKESLYINSTQTFDVSKIYENHFNTILQNAQNITDAIEWNNIAGTVKLTSPVLLCTSLADCNLFSLFELYYKYFPSIANKAMRFKEKLSPPSSCNYSLKMYNELHDRYTPRVYKNNDSCNLIVSFIDRTGKVWSNASDHSFIKGSVKDFESEFKFLHYFSNEMAMEFPRLNRNKSNHESFKDKYEQLRFYNILTEDKMNSTWTAQINMTVINNSRYLGYFSKVPLAEINTTVLMSLIKPVQNFSCMVSPNFIINSNMANTTDTSYTTEKTDTPGTMDTTDKTDTTNGLVFIMSTATIFVAVVAVIGVTAYKHCNTGTYIL